MTALQRIQPSTSDSFLEVQFLSLPAPSAVLFGEQDGSCADVGLAISNF